MMKLEAVEALQTMTSIPFEQARAMPASVYTSQSFLNLELEKIFAKDWYCVGRADAVASQGDYLTCDLAGTPIVVLRDQDEQLRAMSNVCLHRMSTLLQGQGNVRAIVCPYHAWTYNLNGSLRGAPAMELNEDFCKDVYRLPQVRCEEWQGFILVTLNPDVLGANEQLKDIVGLCNGFDMGAYNQTFYEEHIWDTNWKVLAENFMESYHLPVCHAGTIGGLSKLQEMVCPPGSDAFNYHTILKDDTLKIALAHPDNRRLKGDLRRTTFLFAIYPSLMITLTPGYLWYLSLHPLAPGKVHIRFGGGMSPDYVNDANAKAHFARLKDLLDRVNLEDRGCTEKVYRGLSSKLSVPGHLSHLERPNYDFAQYLINRIDA
ncbi:aromatic ring-hydroxylating oxygenase subunit alpha [Pseudopelagicola sp. nBUS_19]|uniref:aromatic ring-hydroxylating oxygenase subunit alpha n=1 Tax=Pseudopelagicola sp. nBUS_19 TaxID=3395316 RepID=UPI003EBE0104